MLPLLPLPAARTQQFRSAPSGDQLPINWLPGVATFLTLAFIDQKSQLQLTFSERGLGKVSILLRGWMFDIYIVPTLR